MARLGRKGGLLLLLAAVVALSAVGSSLAREPKQWREVNWDAVDADWAAGDEEEELVTEDELLAREMDRRKQMTPEMPPG